MLVVTNAGGPGILATDAIVGLGMTMAAVQPTTTKALRAVLPPLWASGAGAVLPSLAVYLLMAGVLVFKPSGLFPVRG